MTRGRPGARVPWTRARPDSACPRAADAGRTGTQKRARARFRPLIIHGLVSPARAIAALLCHAFPLMQRARDRIAIHSYVTGNNRGVRVLPPPVPCRPLPTARHLLAAGRGGPWPQPFSHRVWRSKRDSEGLYICYACQGLSFHPDVACPSQLIGSTLLIVLFFLVSHHGSRAPTDAPQLLKRHGQLTMS